MDTVRLASVDCRADDRLYVQSYSTTDDALWLLTSVAAPVAVSIPDDELGTLVVEALARSARGIERPERLDGLMQPLIRAAGVRSQRRYYEGTRHVSISERDDGTIEVEPSRRRNRQFLPLAERMILLSRPSPEEIAAAVRQAMDISE